MFRRTVCAAAVLFSSISAVAAAEGAYESLPPPPVWTGPQAALAGAIGRKATEGLEALGKYDLLVPEIVEVARRVNAQFRKAGSENKNERSRLTNPFFDRYPVLSYASWLARGDDTKRVLQDTEPELREALASLRTRFTASVECASKWQEAHSLEACEDFYAGRCPPDVGTDGKGKFHQLHVTASFEFKPRNVADPLASRFANSYGWARELDRAECEVAAWQSAVTPSQLIYDDESFFEYNIAGYPDFANVCASLGEVGRIESRLREIQGLFPSDIALVIWDRVLLPEKKQRCAKLAKERCDDVYRIRNTYALSYVTKACTIRKVTVKDIESDASRMAAFGTDAEVEEHRILADRIAACAAVANAGFAWKYVEPKLPAKCSAKAKVPRQKPSRAVTF